MIFSPPGKICDHLWIFGRDEACVYLLEGANGSILINGGISCIVPEILKQFRTFRIDESKINKFLVLHSHFDHVGILPFFKKSYPDMVLYASSRSLEIFKRPKAIQAINIANQYTAEVLGLRETCSQYDVDFHDGISGFPVFDGDCIDIGNMEIRILETPGHSPCSISAYVPELKALFPSDACGIPQKDGPATYGTSNFTKFEESLRKLKYLEIDYMCSDHGGYVTGMEAQDFVSRCIQTAKWRRQLMAETYKRTGNVDEAAKRLASSFRKENLSGMVPHSTFVESFRQMILDIQGLK